MSAATRHFIRHYVEMLVAMFLGMAVLGRPAGIALNAIGSSWSELQHAAPAAMLLAMAVMMTAPMVAWMRCRGHGWPASAEMAGSMLVPTLGAVALLATRFVRDPGALLVLQHAAMLPSMLVAMLLRRREYSCGGHGALHAAVTP